MAPRDYAAVLRDRLLDRLVTKLTPHPYLRSVIVHFL